MPASILIGKFGASPDSFIIKPYLFLIFFAGTYSAGVLAVETPCKPQPHKVTGILMPCPDKSSDMPVSKGPVSIPAGSQPESTQPSTSPKLQAVPPCKPQPHKVTGILMPCPN
ncbi:hypothetical protein [Polynucleobacter sp. IMCC 30228]|uniref:hypothetical protein n=1 Tax=Polynucleobacter sp. IMCC 30228 TaxID=2781011 RepID=UPI001F2D5E6D|nr:hypothetical protein [Polynucleobacter sp. IMCC 30228]MCE7527266.1 hypothetical protein [Polynucleobacter sp. IMCC 30228]